MNNSISLEKIDPDLSKTKVCLIIYSTNRLGYLTRCLESFQRHVKTDQVKLYKILVDDLPKDRDETAFNEIKDKYGLDKLVLNPKNLGLDKNILNSWKHVPGDCEYIWHHEDDHIFFEDVYLDDLIVGLETCPVEGKVQEIGFHRYDYYKADNGCQRIDKLAHKTWDWQGKTYQVALNPMTLRFYFGSTVYRREIIHYNYSRYLPQEGSIFGLIRANYPKGTKHWGAIMHRKGQAPTNKHIGEYSFGHPLSPDQPGWETWVGHGKYKLAKKGYATCSMTGRIISDKELQTIKQIPTCLPFMSESELKDQYGLKSDDQLNLSLKLVESFHEMLATAELTADQRYYLYVKLADHYQIIKRKGELICNTYRQASWLLPNRPEAYLHWGNYLDNGEQEPLWDLAN